MFLCLKILTVESVCLHKTQLSMKFPSYFMLLFSSIQLNITKINVENRRMDVDSSILLAIAVAGNFGALL